ncbi:MAG TPA: endolytic transglycosylase MltG [Actinomycetota bacterium]|nr:endolytic transglycosylase MltG [Actinomycetota bacterium]
MRKVALVLTVLVLAAAGFVVYRVVSYESATHGSPGGEPVKFTVSSGASLSGLGPDLQRAGVIGSTTDFKVYLRVSGSSVNLRRGDYNLRRRMPYSQIVSTLAKGPAISFEKVTIPEGFTLTQTAARVGRDSHVSAADFQAAATTATVVPDLPAPRAATLEGYLYPQTYFIDPKEPAGGLVRRMVSEFNREAGGLSWTSPPAGITPYQALVVASLIQREAKVDEDRAQIAAVIYNRYARGMPLGIDATVYYALGRTDNRGLTQSDLAVSSPYNTRAHPGLPPTPIASPQLSSIQAALQPAQTADLYFVLGSDCKHHVFTSSYQEFLRAKAKQPTC